MTEAELTVLTLATLGDLTQIRICSIYVLSSKVAKATIVTFAVVSVFPVKALLMYIKHYDTVYCQSLYAKTSVIS